MSHYEEKYSAFLAEFGLSKKMVLSTVGKLRVTSRMMSVIQINGRFYFQTDDLSRKYEQLVQHPQLALCMDNIQLEGLCRELGHPLEHEAFCKAYRSCFEASYLAYTHLASERLFQVEPTYLQRWVYLEKTPYVEVFDIISGQYSLAPYCG